MPQSVSVLPDLRLIEIKLQGEERQHGSMGAFLFRCPTTGTITIGAITRSLNEEDPDQARITMARIECGQPYSRARRSSKQFASGL